MCTVTKRHKEQFSFKRTNAQITAMLLSNYTRFNIHKMTLKRFMLPMVFERNTVYTLQQKNFESRSVHSFQLFLRKI